MSKVNDRIVKSLNPYAIVYKPITIIIRIIFSILIAIGVYLETGFWTLVFSLIVMGYLELSQYVKYLSYEREEKIMKKLEDQVKKIKEKFNIED